MRFVLLLIVVCLLSHPSDALGNIRTRNEGTAGSSTISYDATSRVSSSTVTGLGTRSYGYDARGNTTSIGATGFTYDLTNQPVTVTGTGAAAFVYDGNLKRVKEARAGKTIYTIYSRVTGGLIWRDEATDLKQTAYVSAGQASVRFGYNNGTLASAEYIHTDHLGSPVAATNASGNVTWRESYRPFGKAVRILGSAPANDNSTGFTGHLEDDASGYVYMQARYYDPLVPRFLSMDPVGYQDQPNLYAYVHNDPVNSTDPTGECTPALCGMYLSGSAERATQTMLKTIGVVTAGAVAAAAIVVAAPEIAAAATANAPALTEAAMVAGEAIMGEAAAPGVLAGGGALASGLGDLTRAEVSQIQSVVNEAGRPLSVVGSAADGARRAVGSDLPIGKGPGTKSDIDYMATPSSADHFSGLESQLPGIDPKSGILVGVPNEHIGPSIQFDPEKFPE